MRTIEAPIGCDDACPSCGERMIFLADVQGRVYEKCDGMRHSAIRIVVPERTATA